MRREAPEPVRDRPTGRVVVAAVVPLCMAVALSCGQPQGRGDARKPVATSATVRTGQPTATSQTVQSRASAESHEPQSALIRKEPVPDILTALTAMKERDGRDNAMIHYVVAAGLQPVAPNSPQRALIKQVLERGWSIQANALMPCLAEYQPAFEEIRKGVALDFAQNLGLEYGFETPMPDLLAAQTAAKMLCVEGRFYESQRNYAGALDRYLTALTMGRDYGAPGATLIGALVSLAAESIALDSIQDLVVAGRLDRSSLDRLAKRLEAIERTQVSLAEAYRNETKGVQALFRMLREAPAKAQKALAGTGLSAAEIAANLDRIEGEHKRVWVYLMDYANTPCWDRNPEECNFGLEQMLVSCHRATQSLIPSITEADERSWVVRAKLRQVRVAVALAVHRLDRKTYPAGLAALVPAAIAALPVDPFSGTHFVYRPSPDGGAYALYSLGPNRKDDGGVPYDPHHETLSGGDIVLEAQRSATMSW